MGNNIFISIATRWNTEVIMHDDIGGIKIELIIKDFSTVINYDGTQIHPLWALREFGVAGNSIVIFRGSMKVTRDEMIDLMDIIREKDLADILISSDECVHFIIEMFDDQPANLKIAYHRLHLLAYITQKIIEEKLNVSLTKKGTDLYYQSKKLNVGIATSSINSSKLHFGINIVSIGVPHHVKAIGLEDIAPKTDSLVLARDIAEQFILELEAIERAVCKSKVF